MLRPLVAVSVLSVALGGCQLVSQRSGDPARVVTAPAPSGYPVSGQTVGAPPAAFATLPPAGPDVQMVPIRPSRPGSDGVISDKQLAAELDAVVKRLNKQNGPKYVILPPSCVADPELQRRLGTKEAVCYGD